MRIAFGTVGIVFLCVVNVGEASAETQIGIPIGGVLLAAAGYRGALRAMPSEEERETTPSPDVGLNDALKIIDQSGGAGSASADVSGAPLSYIPPPRSINDITEILNRQKPDPAKRAALLARADRQPPAGVTPGNLAQFYLDRGVAARNVGRDRQYLEDLKQANALALRANFDATAMNRYLLQLSQAEQENGDYKAALELQTARMQNIDTGGLPNGPRINVLYLTVIYSATLGRLDTAQDALARLTSLYSRISRSPRAMEVTKAAWLALTLRAEAMAAGATGRQHEAELLARQSLGVIESRIIPREDEITGPSAGMTGSWENNRDILHEFIGRILMRQNRLAEAEAEIRIALLNRLQTYGRFAGETANSTLALCEVLMAAGRFAEAEKLAAAARDIDLALGHGHGSNGLALAYMQLADAQSWQGDLAAARASYGELARVVADSPDLRRKFVDNNLNYAVVALLKARRPEAVKALRAIADRDAATFGVRSFATASARGWLGIAYRNAGNKSQAAEAFAAAMPVLLSNVASGETLASDLPDQRARLTEIVGEAYLSLLAENGRAAAAETFVLADALRSRSVGQALAESAARAAVADPAIANIARHEQDAGKQIGALQAMLANMLSLPSGEQEPGAAQKLQHEIAQLRAARARLRQEIDQRVPAYAKFINPKPASIEQAQKSLRPGEAMVAFYLAADRLFSWAIPAEGESAFASTEIAYRDVSDMVGALRRSVDPNADTLEQIPKFDVAQAYRLYQLLLKPVEAGWGSARTLIVVPHRVLGELPLSLLVTLPTKPVSSGPIRFSGYREVPFLIRKLAVAQLPAAGVLGTLRSLPATSGRSAFIGFGDPWFNAEEEREAGRTGGAVRTAQLHSRGVRIGLRAVPHGEGVSLAQLPRLPDTAEEVRSIAAALHADPARDVFLGAAANERNVRTADLAAHRVIVFATHGLVPGDLPGLQEPALALSAPNIAHVEGDGLLTVDKILGLKLDADWVVLSACNTAAGSGAGAEAISGLGRAFFYAGARALLVSNWPVESSSARVLTTDLFRRVGVDPRLGRAEALREAELALIDGPGAIDSITGRAIYSYAHPIFWAPFAIVGDGGAPMP